MKGLGADPYRWAGLETSGAGFELVGTKKDDSVRGPLAGPVWDLPKGSWGLLKQRVLDPSRGGRGIYLEFPPVDLVA